ncbi:MAG: DUF5615 family PIN-like protein [Planctomycetota bacterium]
MRAAADSAVLARAQSDERVVLTLGKDFHELGYSCRQPAVSYCSA